MTRRITLMAVTLLMMASIAFQQARADTYTALVVGDSIVIIELGGNDGLRGSSTVAMQQNIEKMAQLAFDADAQVLILGMLIPSNYGRAYLQKFSQAFVDAAENTDSFFVPFLLEPIAQDPTYFQRDGIHPTAEAQPLLAEHVIPSMLEILEQSTLVQ